MNNRETKILLLAFLSLAVLCLSVAYAVLSQNLSISGTGTIEGGANAWNVAFVTGSVTTEKKGTATCEAGTVSGTSISGLTATFVKPGDACTITIKVKNNGTINAKLTDIQNKSSSIELEGSESDKALLADQITYSVKYGNETINSSTDISSLSNVALNTNSEQTITLHVEYVNKTETQTLPTAAVTIKGLDRTFIYQQA